MSKISALTVPRWGLSMEEGTLVNWLVNEGDRVNPGDEIAEIESSKIVNVLETHISGTIYRQVAKQDDTLPVGELLAVIADDGVSDAEIDAFIENFSSSAKTAKSDDVSKAKQVENPATRKTELTRQTKQDSVKAEEIPESLKQGADDKDVSASPHARRLATKLGINLNNVTGSGRNGRISVEDIELALEDATGVTETANPDISSVDQPDDKGSNVVEEVPMSPTRQTIAKRLQESKSTVPHYRLVADARVDALSELRAKLNASVTGKKISLNDMLVKACSCALMLVPDCNVQIDGNIIKKFKDVDIAVAVALDSGLITPIIRSVNKKGIEELANEISELIERARNGQLKQDEIEGGTFTISNLGMYGIKQFDAIINPPQCAIIAVGSTDRRVIVEDNKPIVATMMTLSLSLDHRVIDGALGARFMQALVKVIENPEIGNFN